MFKKRVKIFENNGQNYHTQVYFRLGLENAKFVLENKTLCTSKHLLV